MLCGVMAHDIGLEFLENSRDVFVANVHMNEACTIRNVRATTAAVFP